MSHGGATDPGELIEPALAEQVAETMQALATPSRLRILGRLHAEACSVGELATAVGMEASAVSHQLRVLRLLGLVLGRRDGRSVVYELHDEHVGQLLGEAMGHVEHLRLGLAGRGRLREVA
jgi:ArsR family transcriptional regulator, nickel/cobalt-responsive transcriptional repressor